MIRASLVVLLLLMACNRDKVEPPAPPAPVAAGNAERGRILAEQYGCNVCHVFPGIDGLQGSLGPSLAGIATRPTITTAAVPNTPANLTQFIQNPASINPQSAMPPMGLMGNDPQDIVAFLMTLR